MKIGSILLCVAIVVAAGLTACAGTRALIPLLRRAAVIDRPNQRSSHVAPVPRGGGIAVVGAILLGWFALIRLGVVGQRLWVIIGGAAFLAAVSWIDDLRGLPAAVRLVAQFLAAGAGLTLLVPMIPFAGSLIFYSYALVMALSWVWFVNLFNFMDGIDGLAATEASAIGIGMALFGAIGEGETWGGTVFAAIVAAAALGFLVWNWAPARIFLGDVGSVPLGYLLGFLLLYLFARGWWKIALILPLYFLADATITLLRRLVRGERVWQAHREHFYQRAVQRGLSHAAVVRRVATADAALLGCGWAAENGWGDAALIAAAAMVLMLLASLAGLPRRDPRPIPAATPRIEEPPA